MSKKTENYSKLLDNQFQRLVDVFAATDGGEELVKLKWRLAAFGKMADEGDQSAVGFVKRFVAFRNMIEMVVADY